jgi:hypothetical protein
MAQEASKDANSQENPLISQSGMHLKILRTGSDALPGQTVLTRNYPRQINTSSIPINLGDFAGITPYFGRGFKPYPPICLGWFIGPSYARNRQHLGI